MRWTHSARTGAGLAAVLLAAFAVLVLLRTPGQPPASGAGGEQGPPRATAAAADGDRVQAGKRPVAPASAPRSAPGMPADPASIAGSVFDLQGQRIEDIEVVATLTEGGNADGEWFERRATSDAAGRYRIDGLLPGDYWLRSIATQQYPAAGRNVRSGTSSADLILAPRQELWVHGTVTDGTRPLAGVLVVSARDPEFTTYSDATGAFGLFLSIDRDTTDEDALRFTLQDHIDAHLPLPDTDPFATALELKEVRLSRVAGRAAVRGTVLADDSPVAGARVSLRASDHTQMYRSTTDAGGVFEMADVAFGQYTLTVVPDAEYGDHTESGLEVAATGLDLRLSLEPLRTADFRGRMVDIDGQAVPGFSLLLKNLDASSFGSRRVTGDAQGAFSESGVAAGRLGLSTHSEPFFRVFGIELDSGADAAFVVTLDVGSNVLAGRVVDTNSNAVPGARLSLIWAFEADGITSHAMRRGISDTDGYFRFSELGPGPHTLNVSATGFQRRQVRHDVGDGLELRVELTPQ